MFRTFSIAATLSLTLVAAQATEITLPVADYDVTTLKGVDSLQRDIVVASIKVCREEMGVFISARRGCVRSTVDDSVNESQIEPLIKFHFALDEGLRYNPNRPEATVEVLASAQ